MELKSLVIFLPLLLLVQSLAVQADGVTDSDVLEFMKIYEAALESEDFEIVKGLLHEKALFRFNDGDFSGVNNIRSSFENTWAIDVEDNKYFLTNVEVLAVTSDSATVIFNWNWSGLSAEHGSFNIVGRGTVQLVEVDGDLKLILEHLSR